MSEKNKPIPIEKAKGKKKAEVKEALKDPLEIIVDRINSLQKTVYQLQQIERKLMDKVGDLECRLDMNGFPPGQSHWAGFKFKPDGTIEKQETDKFTETPTKLVAEQETANAS